MNTKPFSRSSADRAEAREADALQAVLAGRSVPDALALPEFDILAALARAIDLPAPQVNPAFKAELRARLIAEARAAAPVVSPAARLQAAADRARAKWRYSTGVATATGFAAAALSGGGMAAAAERSVPGDPLYGLKRAAEAVQLWLADDEAERAQQRLEQVGERVREAETALERGNAAAAIEALNSASGTADGGTLAPDAATAPSVNQFLQQQRDAVTELQVAPGSDAEAAVDDVLDALDGVGSVPASEPPAHTTPVVPTAAPTATSIPTAVPTSVPTSAPTTLPTSVPSVDATPPPVAVPTATAVPTSASTPTPTATPPAPTSLPTLAPQASVPTTAPTELPAPAAPSVEAPTPPIAPELDGAEATGDVPAVDGAAAADGAVDSAEAADGALSAGETSDPGVVDPVTDVVDELLG